MSDSKIFTILGVVLAMLIGGGIYYSIQDARKWEDFKQLHKCVETTKVAGTVFNTIGTGSNGQVAVGIGATPSQTGWKCNDGITYFKED